MIEEFPQFLSHYFSPYGACLAALATELDDQLKETGSYGALVLDKQSQYSAAHGLRLFTLLRANSGLFMSNLLEQPLAGDGRHNLMLQITDLLGYLVGVYLKNEGSSKPSPQRHQNTINVIRESMILDNALSRSWDSRMLLMMQELAAEMSKMPISPNDWRINIRSFEEQDAYWKKKKGEET